MILIYIYGIYHWARKRVGYRNDYCLSCQSQNIAEQWLSFDCLHFFFIPILPLGFWRRWRCTVCGNNPHQRVKAGREIKIAGLFCCLFFGIVPWIGAPMGEDLLIALLVSGVSIAGFVGLIYSLCRHEPIPALKEELKRLLPLTNDICPFCQGHLIRGESTQCGSCGVVRHDAR